MTAQRGDTLLLDGEAYSLGTCPALPWHHPRFRKLSEQEAKAASEGAILFSTACWRRYVATWSIADNRLYLLSIKGIYRLDGEEPLFAEWVSETLRVPQGRRLSYVHMGFGSIFERDLFLGIKMGVVEDRRVVENEGISDREALLRGADHLPSADTVTPGLGGRKN